MEEIILEIQMKLKEQGYKIEKLDEMEMNQVNQFDKCDK